MTAIIIFILTYTAVLYAVIFVALALAGIGFPVPDEATLIFSGYLASLGFINLWITLAVACAGLVAADMAGYMAGRYAGDMLARLMARSRHAGAAYRKASDLFGRHGDKIVTLSRPLFGVRVAVPVFAGHAGMPLKKFLALDALAAVPWGIFFVMASYELGARFDFFTKIREIKHFFFLSLGLAIIVLAAVRLIKNTAPEPNGDTRDTRTR
jgi:membrane protein DedA with SNARE-associated domain